ncbi:UDP-N-acetylmuramoyl-tripeptide--D-alanyl-D-alanine ligase [Pasteuria penetrans]|uniref:UDP-N-acetylmuramoyl-tripeptide--D-alanyl-D- alanine ligase n=1 Tax=Pasteuria penetrans TaxID=86005 RepID=UPI0011EECC01|nr:UDP-N-acetylmuramoyl-tripeptide--D-alanyl-D-alanine ligase [Pasteuria penetrans]
MEILRNLTYPQMLQIISGKSLRKPSAFHSRNKLNYGQSKVLSRHHTYFIDKRRSLEKQLADIRRVRPHTIIIPSEWSPRLLSALPFDSGVIAVPHPYRAFFQLAKWSYQHYNPYVFGISGSAGKSTTTAMITGMLANRAPLIRTIDNLNTLYYLPWYISRVGSQHRYLVLEMGMKSRGNIRAQCKITKPHVAAITNVGEAHAGALGGIQQITLAKQELLEGIRKNGIIFLNADDPGTRRLSIKQCPGKIYTFGIKNPATIRAKNVHYTTTGMIFSVIFEGQTYPFRLSVYGLHNVYNALAAIGMGFVAHVNVKKMQHTLANFRSPRMRLQFLLGRRGELLINDAWNANPPALLAGLDVLANVGGKRFKIAVLGDMLELGTLTQIGHARAGAKVAKLSIDYLIAVGRYGPIIARSAIQNGFPISRVLVVRNGQAIVNKIRQLPSHSIIYFKASRALHFENIVRQLRKPS